MRPLVVALFLPAPAFAATFTVPDDGSLTDVLAGTSNGDTVQLRAGTYNVGPGLAIDRSLSLRAVDDDVVTLMSSGSPVAMVDITGGVGVNIVGITFDGGGTNRAIRATGALALTLEGVTGTDLATVGNGALLHAVDTTIVNVRSTTATGGSAQNGAYLSLILEPTASGTLDVRDSIFTGGIASGNGGAIYVENGALTVRDTELTGNMATQGGAVFAQNSMAPRHVQVITSRLEDNMADANGGGLFASGYRATLQGAIFVDNVAASGGGAWMDQATEAETLVISAESTFTGNAAIGAGAIGGAFYGNFDTATLNTLTVEETTGGSGSVFLEIGTGSVTSNVFDSNTASAAGGGLWIEATGPVTVADSIFSNNTAGTDSGALGITATQTTVDASVFTGNDAPRGGAAWFDGGVGDLRFLTFSDNTANRGGAFYRIGTPEAFDVRRSDFFRNEAIFGGAGYIEEVGDFRVLGNFWCQNSTSGSGNRGGALRATSTAGTLVVRNDAGANNTSLRGGTYDVDGFASVDIQFSTFAGNSATNGGIADISDIAGATTLDYIAGIGTMGPAFRGTGVGALTVDRVAFDNVGADFAGDWAGTTPTNPLALPNSAGILNSYPAPTCEDIRLYPSAGSPLLNAGPTMEDLDSSLTDIGMSGGPLAEAALFQDQDGDGFLALDDCDDTNPDSNPNADDICNGLDDDCDGMTDEDPDTQWYTDTDQDGHGVGAPGVTQCEPPNPFSAPLGDDCDDENPAINPSAIEICNTLDDDCNLLVDDDATDASEWAEDLDFDGFGNDANIIMACAGAPGTTDVLGDCDDTLANVYPGAPESCDTLDNDCDGEADNDPVDAPFWYADDDADGYGRTNTGIQQCLAPLDHAPEPGDCADNNPLRNPGAPEICDGIDNNCSGTIDVNPIGPLYYPDVDGDSFGDANAEPVASCSPVAGLITDGTDCDDGAALIFPGAQESCNNVDQDCDGVVDNNSPSDGETFFLDSDQDGFGDDAFPIIACTLPVIASAVGGDCNDSSEEQFPGNTEVCDNRDNDCDGEEDEDDAVDAPTWYADEDDDDYGDDAITVVACQAPVGFVAQGGDCEDTNPTSNPGRLEICDGTDNDCDGEVDGPGAEGVTFFFEDSDGDGFGNPDVELGSCTTPDGFTTNDNDCDDTNANIFPGAPEEFGNDIDENCDGQAPGDGSPSDTGEPGDEKQCGCSASTSTPWALLSLLAAFGMRRRRIQ